MLRSKCHRARIASLGIVFALVLGSCGKDNPIPTGPTTEPPLGPPRSTGPLAFTSNRDGSEAIYLANADGSVVTRLTAGRSPAWSRDRRQIAFNGNPDFGSIYVINVDGSGLRLVTQGRDPASSPDGSRLVFTDGYVIYTADITGSNRRKIFDGEYGASSPAWSPDGRSIAFSVGTFVDSSFPFGLWTVSPDGSGAQNLRPLFDGWAPAWSPDASELAFVTPDGIGVARADGSGRRIVVSGGLLFKVEWTPDGRLSYGRSSSYSLDSMRIFVSDGGGERQLVPEVPSPARANYGDYWASWSR